MTKVTELSIRAKAAVQYPGWRVDFVGPATIALTHVMGRERVIEVRHRRRRRDGPIMRQLSGLYRRSSGCWGCGW